MPEDEIFERTAKFLASPKTPQGLASFQDEMVANALEALRSIQP